MQPRNTAFPLQAIPSLVTGKSFEQPEGRLLLKLLRACGDLAELKAGIVNRLLTEPDLLHNVSAPLRARVSPTKEANRISYHWCICPARSFLGVAECGFTSTEPPRTDGLKWSDTLQTECHLFLYRSLPCRLSVQLYGSFAIVEVTKTLQSEFAEERRQVSNAKLFRKKQYLELLSRLELERKKVEERVLAIREWGLCTEEGLLSRKNSGDSYVSIASGDATGVAGLQVGARSASVTSAFEERKLFGATPDRHEPGVERTEQPGQDGAHDSQSSRTGSSASELAAENLLDDAGDFMAELEQLYLRRAFNATGQKSGSCCCRHCLKTDARDRKFLTVRNLFFSLLSSSRLPYVSRSCWTWPASNSVPRVQACRRQGTREAFDTRTKRSPA